jgi:Ca-activated chloride channel family protein
MIWTTARQTTAAWAVALSLGMTMAGCSNGPSANSSHSDLYAPNPGRGGGVNGNGPAPQVPGQANGVAAGDARALRQPPTFAPEVSAAEDPQSTFALDVDTASYSYARTLISSGQAPRPDTVRPEEFINSFAEDYNQPSGPGFSLTLDGSRMPDTHHTNEVAGMRLLRVGLRTHDDDRGERPDAVLTFVVDVSGSMGDPGKLDVVKDALGALVDQLRPTDSAAIVTFNSRATVALSVTPTSQRADLHHAIDRLAADGSTNLEAGLLAGYRVARDGFRAGATNRVVVLTDGLANTGSTQWQQIVAQVRAEADKQITLLGVGVGRDYGDTLMEQLVDHADGFVVYVNGRQQAQAVFVNRLPATMQLRALDAKAQVTFNPATVQTYRLIGYDDRALADSSYTNDHVDGGEVAAGYTVTALYTVRLVPGATGEVAQAKVRWLDPDTRQPGEVANTIYVNGLDTGFTDASPRLQVCYAAGYFAEVLRGSPYGRQVNLPDLADIARSAAESTADPTVTTLADTLDRAANIVKNPG